MAAKTAQKFSFKSLRLLTKKDSLSNHVKSFSDSEINEDNELNERISKLGVKSKSESCLSNISIDKGLTTGIGDSPLVNNDLNKSGGSKSCSNTNSKIYETSIPEITTSNFLHSQGENQISVRDQHEEKSKKIDLVTNDNETQLILSNLKRTDLYKILEDDGILNETLVGEPRCLTLKKCSGEINPFLTDDSLIFEPDFEDDSPFLSLNPVQNTKKQIVRNTNQQVNDIFLDEEEDKSCKKAVDREEGELSGEEGDMHQRSAKINKTEEQYKVHSEFFKKINECLRDLDSKCRNFYETSTPENYTKHLQVTLSNVDSIKRKLTFLLKTRNSETDKRKEIKKLSKSSSSKSLSKYNIEQMRSRRSENQNKLNSSCEDLNKLTRELEIARGNYDILNIKNVEHHSRHSNKRHGHSRDKPSQTDLLNRKKISILEKIGTKKEIERIQSLFKRQMNIITQHVIQKDETNKTLTTSKKKYDKHHFCFQKENEQIRGKANDNLQTLEDMEEFLNSLKKKAIDKNVCEEYLKKEKNKGALKFTSKKEKNSASSSVVDKPSFSKESAKIKHVLKENTIKEVPECDDRPIEIQNEKPKTSVSRTNEFIAPTIIKPNAPAFKNKAFQEECETLKVRDTESADDSVNEHVTNKCKIEERNTPKISEKESSKCTSQDSDVVLKGSKICFSVGKKESNACEKVQQFNKLLDYDDSIRKNKAEKRKKGKSSYDSHESENEMENTKRKKIEKEPVDRKESPLISGEAESASDDEKKQVIENVGSRYDKSQSEKVASRKEKNNKKRIEHQEIPLISDEKENKLIELSVPEEKRENTENPLVKDLLSKKIFILDDHNLTANSEFRLKIIGTEIYLEKLTKRRKQKHSRKDYERKRTRKISENHSNANEQNMEVENQAGDAETNNTTLEEMESFLQELRSKRKTPETVKEQATPLSSQSRELKFLARIRAKRKAKLMAACTTGDPNSTEKEAKFLKALEKRNKGFSDESDVEGHKQKFIEKFRAEVDAIVLGEKPGQQKQNIENDPLMDVKNFLNMIKGPESSSDENFKQNCISFSLKRSDVKKLENITSGRISALTEESQKLLNSVRSKMKAKKVPVSNISALMLKPET